MKKIFISILNFNSLEATKKCLRSIKNLEKNDFELFVIVLDNGSKEFELKEDFISPLPLKVIKSSENLGFSGGHNLCFNYALANGADYVLVLNNDTTVDKKVVSFLLQTAQKDEKNGIIVPKIYFAKGSEYHKERYKEAELGKVFWYAGGRMDWANVLGSNRGVDEVDKGQYDNTEETELATGCCMLVKKEVLKTLGGFDDDYFLYYEDNDFCQRAKRAGFKIFYEPKAIIWHENAGSGGGSGSPLQDYYITRNRLLIGSRYAPLRARIALFRESLKLLIKGREWQKKGIRDFYLKKFGKGSYG